MASRGINKVILVGNLGNDPESRFLPSGGAVTNVTIATSESWKDKQTGQPQERTEWHRVVFFNRLAEVVNEYLHKGSKVYIEGQLRTRKWQDKQTGGDRYTTEIVAKEMQMLDSRQGGQQNTGQQQHHSHERQGTNAEHPSSPQNYQQSGGQSPGQRGGPAPQDSGPPAGDFGDFNDDIPF